MEFSIRKRMAVGFMAMLVVIVFGTTGYHVLGQGKWTVSDCAYMTFITITTAGFGEVLDGMHQMPNVRWFTVVLLVFGTGVLVYFASTVTAFIIEGDLQHMLRKKRLAKRIRHMQGHVIVCGAGSTGRHIIEELLAVGRSVVAIDVHEPLLVDIANAHPKADFSYLVGDATDDHVMDLAALPKASGLVAALSSDKDNLYLVVSARQLNNKARVVARAAELSHIEKLRRAGADSVVSPNHIGGMRMVSELLRPAVVRFLDDMVRDTRATYRIEEVRVENHELFGRSLRDAKIRENFGMTVLAMKPTTTPWIYNPEASEAMQEGMILVVLGSLDQIKGLRNLAKSRQAPES